MGSRERLWAKYGRAWGWPPETVTYEEDWVDLARHEAEIAAHEEAFNYAVLNEGETKLLGCVYIDPPEPVDEAVATDPEGALQEFVPL
jgi:L-amino acid N-acyltransferase YncA